MDRFKWWMLLFTLGLVPAATACAADTTIYVDNTLANNCIGTYDPHTRSCGTGNATAYHTLQKAANAVRAGDTVLIRSGAYQEALIPARSGREGQHITFKNYGVEEVIITGPALTPAIDISNRQYLVIEGLKIQDVRRWMYALNAHRNIIRDNTFLRAMDPGGSSKTGLFFQDATHNKIVNNHVEDSTQDNLSLVRADRTLIEGNTFRKAAHTLWTIKCGNFNVLRRNYFHNERQKIGEIYDCDRVGFNHDITMFNATKHNLVEQNIFAYTPPSGNKSPYAGIQYAGQNGIIRYNRFYDMVGPGLDLTLYSKEAQYNTDNRVYHNVFYKTSFAGISLARRTTFSGNIFKNNILAKSRFVANDTRWAWYRNELSGKSVQLMTGRLDGFLFVGNAFFGNAGNDEPYLITYGVRNSGSNPVQRSLSWWQTNYPELFRDNVERDPLFANETDRDFHLRPGSRMVDSGVFLTRTVGAGSGTQMTVEDVGYFFDGYDIPGETGDLIQLEGQTHTVKITKVDYVNKTLTLDQPLTWEDRQGVHLPYVGSRPDIGADEFPPAQRALRPSDH